MNSQERTSGGFRREKRSIPKTWLRAPWLFGMTAALALGWLGTTWIRERVQETDSAAKMARLARLDAEAQEFLDQAHRAIPEIVFELTRFPNMFRLWKRLARDKLCGTQLPPVLTAELVQSLRPFMKRIPARVIMRRSRSNFRTASRGSSCRRGFMRRSISCGIRSKRNCMEVIPAVTTLIRFQTDRKTLRRAEEQEIVRMMGRQVRNSSRICLIWHYTCRDEDAFQRFESLAARVQDAIVKGVFLPNETSFACAECPYKNRCKNWR